MISSKMSVMGCFLPRTGFFPGSVMSIDDSRSFLCLSSSAKAASSSPSLASASPLRPLISWPADRLLVQLQGFQLLVIVGEETFPAEEADLHPPQVFRRVNRCKLLRDPVL